MWTDTQSENITFSHPSDAGGNNEYMESQTLICQNFKRIYRAIEKKMGSICICICSHYNCSFSSHIRVFRSARVDGASEEDVVRMKQLGIKTIIDLRASNEFKSLGLKGKFVASVMWAYCLDLV